MMLSSWLWPVALFLLFVIESPCSARNMPKRGKHARGSWRRAQGVATAAGTYYFGSNKESMEFILDCELNLRDSSQNGNILASEYARYLFNYCQGHRREGPTCFESYAGFNSLSIDMQLAFTGGLFACDDRTERFQCLQKIKNQGPITYPDVEAYGLCFTTYHLLESTGLLVPDDNTYLWHSGDSMSSKKEKKFKKRTMTPTYQPSVAPPLTGKPSRTPRPTQSPSLTSRPSSTSRPTSRIRPPTKRPVRTDEPTLVEHLTPTTPQTLVPSLPSQPSQPSPISPIPPQPSQPSPIASIPPVFTPTQQPRPTISPQPMLPPQTTQPSPIAPIPPAFTPTQQPRPTISPQPMLPPQPSQPSPTAPLPPSVPSTVTPTVDIIEGPSIAPDPSVSPTTTLGTVDAQGLGVGGIVGISLASIAVPLLIALLAARFRKRRITAYDELPSPDPALDDSRSLLSEDSDFLMNMGANFANSNSPPAQFDPANISPVGSSPYIDSVGSSNSSSPGNGPTRIFLEDGWDGVLPRMANNQQAKRVQSIRHSAVTAKAPLPDSSSLPEPEPESTPSLMPNDDEYLSAVLPAITEASSGSSSTSSLPFHEFQTNGQVNEDISTTITDSDSSSGSSSSPEESSPVTSSESTTEDNNQPLIQDKGVPFPASKKFIATVGQDHADLEIAPTGPTFSSSESEGSESDWTSEMSTGRFKDESGVRSDASSIASDYEDSMTTDSTRSKTARENVQAAKKIITHRPHTPFRGHWV